MISPTTASVTIAIVRFMVVSALLIHDGQNGWLPPAQAF